MARSMFAALALSLMCLPSHAHAIELASHRAFYELALTKKGSSSNIVQASGGMAIEVSETCDAWLTNQRLRLRVAREEGEEIVTDNNFSSWESKDGLRYRFTVRNRLNGQVSEQFRGEAHLKPNGGAGVASFSQPAKRDIALPKGTLFPTQHVVELLENARLGAKLFHRTVFDGTTVDGADEISVFIGLPKPLEKLSGLETRMGLPSWPMRWAFFPTTSKSERPDYEIAVRMLADGVAADLSLVYEDFEVGGKIQFFKELPKPKC